MTAVNYARHDRGHYVFLEPGEKPEPAWLEPSWAWHERPTPYARKIGETRSEAEWRVARSIER